MRRRAVCSWELVHFRLKASCSKAAGAFRDHNHKRTYPVIIYGELGQNKGLWALQAGYRPDVERDARDRRLADGSFLPGELREVVDHALRRGDWPDDQGGVERHRDSRR